MFFVAFILFGLTVFFGLWAYRKKSKDAGYLALALFVCTIAATIVTVLALEALKV